LRWVNLASLVMATNDRAYESFPVCQTLPVNKANKLEPDCQ